LKMRWPNDRLTRFEIARLIGARSLQIALGAPVLTKTEETGDSINIAKMEFKQKLIPITIKRTLPSGEEVVVNIRKAIDNWLAENTEEN